MVLPQPFSPTSSVAHVSDVSRVQSLFRVLISAWDLKKRWSFVCVFVNGATLNPSESQLIGSSICAVYASGITLSLSKYLHIINILDDMSGNISHTVM